MTEEGRKEDTDPTPTFVVNAKMEGCIDSLLTAHFRHLPRNIKKKHQYARAWFSPLTSLLTLHPAHPASHHPAIIIKDLSLPPISLFFFFKHYFPPLHDQPTPFLSKSAIQQATPTLKTSLPSSKTKQLFPSWVRNPPPPLPSTPSRTALVVVTPWARRKPAACKWTYS